MTDRLTTHAQGCWSWGPRHYECAVGHNQRGPAANKPTLGKREANATPPEFRDELIRLARMARPDGGVT